MNGGYTLVDCKGLNLLAQSSQTITGLYARMVDAVKSGKPIIACNCNYGVGVPSTPISVMVIDEDGTYIATNSILQILVSSDDSVTIRNLLTLAGENRTVTKSVKK